MNSEYKRWCQQDLEELDLMEELRSMQGKEEIIEDHFGKSLSFGTAGLRGVLGVGTNRMNRFVVRQTTQGLAHYVNQIQKPRVAISYDTRLKGWDFAKDAACVLAANGIHVYLYSAAMPVPALSFATRYYHCGVGIMLTASHNPSTYNGYKVYGEDGCQLTDEGATTVYDEIQKTDIFTGVKRMSFAKAIQSGLVEFVEDDCLEAFYQAVLSQQVRQDVVRKSGLRLVYSPLNGTGLVPVCEILKRVGIQDIYLVKEQAYPNGYFSTCTYPNPEKKETMELGIALAKQKRADLVLATDPDADRVGIAARLDNGEYHLISGNEMGVLLLDYLAKSKKELGTLVSNPIAVRSIVSTPLADEVAREYGVELRHTLTGFKWIGDQIHQLEEKGEESRFLFGFEESYGYLSGTYVRDKDAVVASMLICEMAAYYRSVGSSIVQALQEIYQKHGYYYAKVMSYEFTGFKAMEEMAAIMNRLRKDPMTAVDGQKVMEVVDYEEETGLPKANVLSYHFESGTQVMVRPSGTEPKLKIYLTVVGKNQEAAQQKASLFLEDLQQQLRLGGK
ncbi:phosphoglucomutase/phosphomannomutase, alpha/beta/alpha domain II [Bulleidia extructa W1219]|uniref:Phosphoglucomutase n=1 Tax=Bulleidia extructa W1219 TaxID=679192 RepID=D2MMA6_9FIRM|nr:phospho-sugar mutase [Bulleidia extructa]EFC06182.1 phosphoglucomutase/phosphomannomutase, alpha/beta/alpha domain II [Bulleidia extructa W1219]